MKTIRDYITLIEQLNEASWWGAQPQAAAAPPPPQGEPIKGNMMYVGNSNKGTAPAPTEQYSDAVNDLALYASHHEQGRDDHYDHIIHLASYLKQSAPENGMQQFIPMLDKILQNPEKSSAFAYQLQKDYKQYANGKTVH